MREEAIYRCVNPACARPMPRPVNFCPWCGTAQGGAQAGVRAASPAQADAQREAADAAALAASAAAAAAAQLSGWADAPEAALPAAAPDTGAAAADAARDAGPDGVRATRTGFARAGTRTGAGSARATADDTSRGIRLGTLFGHGQRGPEPGPASQSVPRPPLSPTPVPPRRKPVRLRWWLVFMLMLAGVWYVARPNGARRIDARIDHAATLAKACKAREAQDELIALRKTRATPAQLARLQDALNEGAAACTRQRQRDKAWGDASAAAEAALADGNVDRAHARLQAYTRRWGEDARTRALRDRIEDARHPLAAPAG